VGPLSSWVSHRAITVGPAFVAPQGVASLAAEDGTLLARWFVEQ
jgi:hypothetical protein